jgi:Zn-dependent protease
VYRNPKDFPEYDAADDEEDYANPNYYLEPAPAPPQSVESAPTEDDLDVCADYPTYSSDPAYIEDLLNDKNVFVHEYRDPRELAGYISNILSEQRGTAKDNDNRDNANDRGKKRKGLAGLGSIGAAIVAFMLKFQWLVFLLKFGLAGITALISVAAYALFWGWSFAIGLVVLLFVHEMGHALVMRLKGIPLGGLVFIPLLGAAVTMRQMPQNARDEAEVGIAGPIAGTIAASACLLLEYLDPARGPLWASLAYFGFFINLFNLIPIVPFDGGRILAAIDRRVWIIGFLGLLAFQIWSWIHGNFSIWLLFFIFMAAVQLWTRGLRPDTAQAKAYYEVPIATRVMLSVVYFGLAAVLVLGMSVSRGVMSGLP